MLLLASNLGLPHQVAYMVWDKGCITKLEQTDHFYLDAPMVDGKPDMARAVFHGLMATYDPGCGRYEVRSK